MTVLCHNTVLQKHILSSVCWWQCQEGIAKWYQAVKHLCTVTDENLDIWEEITWWGVAEDGSGIWTGREKIQLIPPFLLKMIAYLVPNIHFMIRSVVAPKWVSSKVIQVILDICGSPIKSQRVTWQLCMQYLVMADRVTYITRSYGTIAWLQVISEYRY